MNNKRCPECGQTKPHADFGNNKRTADGKAPYCKVCSAAKLREWKADNKDKVSAQAKRYYERHAAEKQATAKKWKEANPAVVAAITRRHRSARKNNTPRWADVRAMNEVYMDAKEFRRAGVSVHVDHIIPLQGEFVSGLHVPENLTIKLASWNAGKGNKFDVS